MATNLRAVAISSLGFAGNADATATLAGLLDQADLTKDVVDALARLKGTGIDQALMGRLAGATPALKTSLVTVLGQRNHYPAFAAALAETTSPDAGLRDAAFQAVGLLATAKEMPALLDVLITAKSDREIRALGKALTQALRGGADPDVATALVLERLGKAGTEDIRQQMYLLLSLLDCAKAHDALDAVFAAPDLDRRKELLRVLAKSRQGHTVPVLMKAAKSVKDPSETVLVIRAALECLPEDKSRGKEARIPDFEALWKLAQRDEDREAVIAALAKMGTDKKLTEAANRLKALAPAPKIK